MRDGPSLVKPMGFGASSDPFILTSEHWFGKGDRGSAGLQPSALALALPGNHGPPHRRPA